MRRPSPGSCARLAAAIETYVEKAEDDELLEELKAAGFVEPEETLRTVRRVEKIVRGIYARTTKNLVESLKGAVDLSVWARMEFPKVQMNDRMAHEVAEVFMHEFSTNIPAYVSRFHADIGHPRAIASMTLKTAHRVDQWSQMLGGMMKLDEYRTLKEEITRAVVRGAGTEELAREIYKEGIRDRPWKARRVAVTEMLRAQSFAQMEAMSESPSVNRKRWIHSGEHKIKPRENHQAIDGQTKPVEEPFDLIGADGEMYHPMYPRDPELPAKESINCHCIMMPVTDDAVTGVSDKEWNRLTAEARAELREDTDWEKELNEKYRAASEAFRAERQANQGPVPVYANTNKRLTWFRQIDGVTTSEGQVAHISGEHIFTRMEEKHLSGSSVVDALLHPVKVSRHHNTDGTTSINLMGVRATVALEPETHNIKTVFPTKTKYLIKERERELGISGTGKGEH